MQSWHEGWLRECYRVLKPGGVIKAFSGTRTFHRLTAAMENVGFVLDPKESLEAWIYASGFPKSLNVSKAIDSHMRHGKSDPRYISETDSTRPVVGHVKRVVSSGRLAGNGETEKGVLANRERWLNHESKDIPVTAPATEEAKRFEGYGTALKPAWEPFICGRKPE